jgi:Flagellar Assembly Protein A beta solenoid domain
MGGSPLLIHGHVGPVSGRVVHRGDVWIEGSVLSGGAIHADGDVHIVGHVTDAQVLSGGNLTVEGIVSGPQSVLDAVGRVSVRQALDAKILAGKDMVVLCSLERCDVSAGGDVLVEGTLGLVRGGVTRVGRSFQAARILAAQGSPARLTIGGTVFDEDPEELQERLTFMRTRTIRAKTTPADTVESYRRGLAEHAGYRNLARSLARRLKQLRVSDRIEKVPTLSITGHGPIEATVRMGPEETPVDLPEQGPIQHILAPDGPACRPPEEVVREW